MTKSSPSEPLQANEHIQGAIGAHLAKRIVKRRKALGLSEGHTDQALGKSKGWISGIEAGAKPIRADDLLALAQVFTIGLDYFFNGFVLEQGTMTEEEALALLNDFQNQSDQA
ncbi:MAG: helix-turn-helix domain-containing protein [Magnetovibrionaceae bacterium]